MSKQAQRAKAFFKTSTASEHGVEMLKMFILPFLRGWDPSASVDDAIGAFFNIQTRKFYGVTAVRDFNIPGEVGLTATLYSKKCKERKIDKGQRMLLVVDSKEKSVKVQVKEKMFRLRPPDYQFFKECVEIVEI